MASENSIQRVKPRDALPQPGRARVLTRVAGRQVMGDGPASCPHAHRSHSTSRPLNFHRQVHPCYEKPAESKNTLSRSEEHTSEPQSLMRISYAVFCLKKKK